ncbi:U3 small nucleolar RNA-associated protein 21-like protein [Erysiphe neolycopersici]|uniref:U3 small nucleolar RNA-associated protein 21-like protein n=1 Tax=Erysiphe neolycopersici TaxID=212602 RepID=A0A420I0I9_9PEZI|nr:U3 small nucleolar RNA-associated protein 21-like protein [Erysiphe neolycopersici]
MPDLEADINFDGPAPKRQKLSNVEVQHASSHQSRLFTPFRTIGLVSSTCVPFTSTLLGKDNFQITTSVGNCLQTYSLKQGLQLIFLTRPQTPEKITATYAWRDEVFAAWGGPNTTQGLWVFRRGKKVAEIEIPSNVNEAVQQILIFGSWIVGCCSTRIEVWNSESFEHYTTLYSTKSANGGHELSGGISNMPTYLNKIFAGRKDGCIEVWNVRSGKLIYTIPPPAPNCGAITAIQSTPALSLLAIAYSKGPLVIHNVKIDKTIIYLDGGSSIITSISFRTDNLGAGEDGRKPGVMATTGPSNGDVTFWDLNNGGRVMGVLRGAHYPPLNTEATVGGGVTKIQFLPSQPILVSNGLDNSLKSWIFDESPFSPIPRILHSRNGHAAPASQLLFIPSDFDGADLGGKWLLSSGSDRSLWAWSLRRDGQSTELSQGNIHKKAKKIGNLSSSLINDPSTVLSDLKAPEIICISMSLNRDGGMGANSGDGSIWQKSRSRKKFSEASASGVTGWESIVTGHKDESYARTWFWGRKKAGRWILETGDGSNVKSVTVSPCGTFAVIGSEKGHIDMYNLQSGLHRSSFPPKLSPGQARNLLTEKPAIVNEKNENIFKSKYSLGRGKHTSAVTGLVVDSLNKNIFSCSLDGKVKFWDFRTGFLMDEISWSSVTAIAGIRYYSSNDLIAVVCQDLCIRIIDVETKKTIRELWGCQGSVNDWCFSNDGRWIIAASSDCVIRVWDLPTGNLIDGFRTKNQSTAIAFSSTGEFLATTSKGELGINIWNNKTLFTHVPTRNISENDIVEAPGPVVSGEGGFQLLDAAFEDVGSISEYVAPISSFDQLSKDLQTLSLLPKSRWQNLLYLDVIKARNKPVEPPKIPEKAPFFLSSLEKSSVQNKTDEKSREITMEKSRIMKLGHLTTEGEFTTTLRIGYETGEYASFFNCLKSLSPSVADLEIRSLNPHEEFVPFITALTNQLRAKLDYELIQAWMSVFLRLHSDSIIHDQRIIEAIKAWREEQARESERIGELLSYCSGVIGFLRT